MDTFKFNVQSSDVKKEPYEVQFFMVDGVFSGSCECGAGKNGQACGHRIDVLEGKKKPVDYSEKELQTVLQWYLNSDLKVKVSERNTLEEDLAILKKKVESVKKEISKLLNR